MSLRKPDPVVEIGADDVFTCGADGDAIGSFVARFERQTLPHGDDFAVLHPFAIIVLIFCVGYLLRPVEEAAQEFAVIVGVAGRKIEAAVRANGFHRARSNTEFAFNAWVVVERFRVVSHRCTDKDRIEQNEVAKFWMNDIAMEADLAHASGFSDGLVGDRPAFAGKVLHFHGKGGDCIHRGDAPGFTFFDNVPGGFVH